MDLAAFEQFKVNNTASLTNRRGHIQWQNSNAQLQALDDIATGAFDTYSRHELFYMRDVYHENFDLKEWNDRIDQEIQTAKYLHKLGIKGKNYKASYI